MFIAAILLVKLLFLALDHRPVLFLGDSAAYLNTAVKDTIPTDRSFTYGYLIRHVAVTTRSLGRLVAFQTMLGAFSSILLAYLLREYFRTGRAVAFTMGFLSAVEPLQLMYERYVLTETVTLFVFALYTLLAFQYIAGRRLFTLMLMQVAAILLISLRISFVPLAWACALAVPLLAAWDAGLPRNKARMAAAAASVFASVLLLGSLIEGYKQVNGALSGRPPAMQYASGHFLLSGVAPIVKPGDLPLPEHRDRVFSPFRRDLGDRRHREFHRWIDGGLIHRIQMAVPGLLNADAVSKETAVNAIKRDPVGVARLTLLTYADYFDLPYFKECLVQDRGVHELKPWLLRMLRHRFRYRYDAAPGMEVRSVTGSFFMISWPWYCLLALTPFLALAGWGVCPAGKRRYAFVLLLFAVTIVGPIMLVGPHPVARYLHPLAWIALILGGVFADRARNRVCLEH